MEEFVSRESEKDPGDGSVKRIALLNALLNIFAKRLAKRLALVMDKLVGEEQTCAILTRTIHDNLQSMRYITEREGDEVDIGRTLINLDQFKAFDEVDHTWQLSSGQPVVGPVSPDKSLLCTMAYPRLFG